MEKLDAPYRSQPLRPPAPPRTGRRWAAVIERSVLRLVALVMVLAVFVPAVYPITAACTVIGVAGTLWGLWRVARGLGARDGILVWEAVVVVAAALLTASVSIIPRCAEQRETQIIRAVHAWRAAHGRYPESLEPLALTSPPVCALRLVPSIVSGHITYRATPDRDDALLVREFFFFARRSYDFRTRRLGFVD